jgi:hypothetical protein
MCKEIHHVWRRKSGFRRFLVSLFSDTFLCIFLSFFSHMFKDSIRFLNPQHHAPAGAQHRPPLPPSTRVVTSPSSTWSRRRR